MQGAGGRQQHVHCTQQPMCLLACSTLPAHLLHMPVVAAGCTPSRETAGAEARQGRSPRLLPVHSLAGTRLPASASATGSSSQTGKGWLPGSWGRWAAAACRLQSAAAAPTAGRLWFDLQPRLTLHTGQLGLRNRGSGQAWHGWEQRGAEPWQLSHHYGARLALQVGRHG